MLSIRVELPPHLRSLAGIKEHEVALEVASPPDARAIAPSIAAVLDALEAAYPMLCGTIRDHASGERRAFLRFFACQHDLSLEPIDAPLPRAVAEGREPLIVLGAVAGGAKLYRRDCKFR
jgi:molybdopterin synthase sulfur carrier subunit